MENPLANFIHQWEVGAVGIVGGTAQSIPQPLGVVTRNLMAAYLEHGAVADKSDHEKIDSAVVRKIALSVCMRNNEEKGKNCLVFEKSALHRITRSAAFQCLNFIDEFTDVVKLAINGNIAHIGNRINRVEFIHYLSANRSGWHFG
jgi:hypothetical protein